MKFTLEHLSWFDAYTETGNLVGAAITVFNKTPTTIFISLTLAAPSDTSAAFPVPSGQTVNVPFGSLGCWIFGSGEVFIQRRGLQESRHVELSKDLFTSERDRFRRLRVDIGQTGFFEGREFRIFKEFNIPVNTTLTLEIVVPVNGILFEQGMELDNGAIRITNATGGTPGGTFSEVITPIGKNNMSDRPTPFYLPQVTWKSGGSHTGGFVFDIHRVVSPGATAQQTTVGNIVGDERGIAVGTYYVKYENIGVGSATGTLWFFYEERP